MLTKVIKPCPTKPLLNPGPHLPWSTHKYKAPVFAPTNEQTLSKPTNNIEAEERAPVNAA